MADPYVPIDRMRDKLLTVDTVRERLAATEPLSPVLFSTSGDPSIQYESRWASRELTDPAPVWLTVPSGERYQLTKQAAWELGSEARIPRQLQEWWDPYVLQQAVNWGLNVGLGEKELKLLCAGTGRGPDGEEVPLAVAMCRSTVTPFSNLRLLDAVLEGVSNRYGEGEVLCDYKLQHDLEATAVRVIVPGAHRVIQGSGTDDDTWSTGIQFKNSAIGLKQTFIDGYLFRWWCTNGEIDIAHSSGGFSRRGTEESEVYEWAREAVDEVLGGIEEHSFDAVQSLTSQNVEGHVVTVLRDLFGQARLPRREQNRVLESMLAGETGEELTMYNVVNAITQVANADDLTYRARENLMSLGGMVIHTQGARCDENHPCRRLLPPDWSPEGRDEEPGDSGPENAELN